RRVDATVKGVARAVMVKGVMVKAVTVSDAKARAVRVRRAVMVRLVTARAAPARRVTVNHVTANHVPSPAIAWMHSQPTAIVPPVKGLLTVPVRHAIVPLQSNAARVHNPLRRQSRQASCCCAAPETELPQPVRA